MTYGLFITRWPVIERCQLLWFHTIAEFWWLFFFNVVHEERTFLFWSQENDVDDKYPNSLSKEVTVELWTFELTKLTRKKDGWRGTRNSVWRQSKNKTTREKPNSVYKTTQAQSHSENLFFLIRVFFSLSKYTIVTFSFYNFIRSLLSAWWCHLQYDIRRDGKIDFIECGWIILFRRTFFMQSDQISWVFEYFIRIPRFSFLSDCLKVKVR